MCSSSSLHFFNVPCASRVLLVITYNIFIPPWRCVHCVGLFKYVVGMLICTLQVNVNLEGVPLFSAGQFLQCLPVTKSWFAWWHNVFYPVVLALSLVSAFDSSGSALWSDGDTARELDLQFQKSPLATCRPLLVGWGLIAISTPWLIIVTWCDCTGPRHRSQVANAQSFRWSKAPCTDLHGSAPPISSMRLSPLLRFYCTGMLRKRWSRNLCWSMCSIKSWR